MFKFLRVILVIILLCLNVHRKDVGSSRNQWAIEQLRQIRRLDY